MTDQDLKALIEETWFFIDHSGDGGHSVLARSYKQAAELAIKGMWSGTLEDALQDEFLKSIYDDIIDPEGEEWLEYGGTSLHWSFEDGALSVNRFKPSPNDPILSALKEAQGLRAENERLRQTLNLVNSDCQNGHYVSAETLYAVQSACGVFDSTALTSEGDG